MKKGEDFKEEELLKILFQQSATEPSQELKENIMRQIEVSKSKAFQYQPVISTKSWVMILSSFLTLMAYLIVRSFLTPFYSFKLFDFVTKWELSNDVFKSWSKVRLPELPYPMMMAISVLIIFGIYFMLSIRFGKKFFRDY